MNKQNLFIFVALCLSFVSPITPESFLENLSLDHGVGVLKRVSNNSYQDLLVRFADSAYPAIKPGGSTDDFNLENKPLKLISIFGSTMLLGIIGVMAMKSNPQQRIANMQQRINKAGTKFAAKVDEEQQRLSNVEKGEKAEQQSSAAASSETMRVRAAEEKKWLDFIKKTRDQEDEEYKKKETDPTISRAEKIRLENEHKKRIEERKKADDYQKKLGEAQREGGLSKTLWADKKNTKNEWFNEKTDISREINDWKGMRGKNTIQDRERDRAFYMEGYEKMTDSEKTKALQLRKEEQATHKEQRATLDAKEEKKKFWQAAREQGGFTNSNGSAMSKGKMVKTVLWDRALGQKKKTKSTDAAKERSNVARNLVLAGAAIGAGATALAAISEDMGSKAIENLIPWEIPDGKFRCPINQNPMMLGFGQSFVQDFREGGILRIQRMMGVGAAWLQRPLPLPLSFTLKFKLKTLDAGGVHIVLREGLDLSAKDAKGLDFDTKIMIGCYDNSVTAISNHGTIVAQIKKDQYPAASIPPGIFTPYWLSYDNGFIMLGLGQPGDNVILSWCNPSPNPNVDHIGLSCDTAQVEFSEMYFSPPVVSKVGQKKFFFNNKEQPLAYGISWLGYSFREPGRGTISFQKKGGPVNVYLALSPADDAPRIAFTLGSESDEPITVRYTSKETQELIEEQIGVISDPYPNDPEKFNTYWVSNQYGQFTVGHSQPVELAPGQFGEPQPGSNLIACISAPYLAEADTIGFSLNPDYDDSSATIKNLAILAPAELSENLPPGYIERRKFSGALKVVYPFSYLFRQSGQSVEVQDTISGETWYPAKTPQQQATYFFEATITPDGSLSMHPFGEPKNPVKFGIGAAAMAIQQSAGLVNTMATQIGQSGTDIISQIITAAASVGMTGVAVGMNIAAGALTAEAKYGYRDKNAYVYTETAKQQNNTSTEVPEEVQKNQAQIETIIKEAAAYKQSFQDRFNVVKMEIANAQMLAEGARDVRSTEDRHREQLKFFELFITSYKRIIPLINHAIIGNNAGMKKNIFEALFFINQAIRTLYTQIEDLPQKKINTDAVINLFLSARQNPYLLNNRISDDRNRAKLWSTWIQDLAGQALTSIPAQDVALNPMFGEYLWFNEPTILPMSQNGSVFFEAEGLNDIFVGIIDVPQDVRNTENDVYEVVFGGNNNTKSFIRIKSLGRSVAEVSGTENPNAVLTPMKKESFWVSLKDGTISAGKGAWGEGKILEWTDPYPIAGARVVGLSTWNSPVTFGSIRVGPCVEELTPELRQEILNKQPEQKESQADKDKAALMQDSFKDLKENDTLQYDNLTENDFVRNDMLSFDLLQMGDLDELTHDILQDNVDAAAGGDPRKKLAAAQAAAAARAAKKPAPKKQNVTTAAEKKQMNQQMASGGLGQLFQEKFQLMGKNVSGRLAKGTKEKALKIRNAFRRKKITATPDTADKTTQTP